MCIIWDEIVSIQNQDIPNGALWDHRSYDYDPNSAHLILKKELSFNQWHTRSDRTVHIFNIHFENKENLEINWIEPITYTYELGITADPRKILTFSIFQPNSIETIVNKANEVIKMWINYEQARNCRIHTNAQR